MDERPIFCAPTAGKVVLVGNDYVVFRVLASESSTTHTLLELVSLPGSSIPLHIHEFRELYVVIEGTYVFQWKTEEGLQTATAETGASLSIPPNVPHAYRNNSGQTARMVAVLTPGGFEAFFAEVGGSVDRVGDQPVNYEPLPTDEFLAALGRFGLRVVGGPPPA